MLKDQVREYIKTNLGINDEETFQSLYETYKDAVSENIVKIAAALESKNSEDLRYASHALKGCSANIGAEEIRKVCYSIEMAAKNSEFAICSELYPELKKLTEYV